MVVVAKLEMEEGRLVHVGEDARWTGGRGRDLLGGRVLPPSWQWGPGPPRLADPSALPLAHRDWPRERHLIQTGSVSPPGGVLSGAGRPGSPSFPGGSGDLGQCWLELLVFTFPGFTEKASYEGDTRPWAE